MDWNDLGDEDVDVLDVLNVEDAFGGGEDEMDDLWLDLGGEA